MTMESEIERQEREYFEAALASANAGLAEQFRQAVATANAFMPLPEAEREALEAAAYEEALAESGGRDRYGSLP